MTRFTHLFLITAFTTAGLIPVAFAADGDNRLTIKTERVIVFKDGHFMVIKRATGKTNADGELFTDEVPDSAVLGSFWATPKTGTLRSMTAGWTEAETKENKTVTATKHIEILESNKGKQATVTLNDKNIHNGVIREVLVNKTASTLTPHMRTSLNISSIVNPTATSVVSGTNGSMFVLRTEDGDVLLPVSSIATLTVKDMKTTVTREIKTTKKTKRLTFQLDKPNVEREMLITYFRPGIRWVPTYRINLQKKGDEKYAKIALQAELINEAEDLDGVPIDIVVGVPNFRFKNHVSPLVLESVMRNALQQAAPLVANQFRNDFSNSIYGQRSADFRRQGAHANAVQNGGAVKLPGELTASGTQDLFVYNLPKLKLKKGQRSAVPIFTTEAPYRDLYTWDVHIKRRATEMSPSAGGSPLKLAKNDVWHQIEILNNTNVPWTTGAAMIMQGNQPLAQELLTYTSPKDHVRVPVTVAVDIRPTFDEQETSRQMKSMVWRSYHYAKIMKQAKLDICNNKNQAVNIEVNLFIGGRVNTASNEGKITLDAFNAADWERYYGDHAANNSSRVHWKATLKPGETFEPTVDYHYFLRH